MRNTTFRRRYERLLGSDPEADARVELENHIASRMEDLIGQGRMQAEARAQAEREFGDVARIRREMNELGRRRRRRERRARRWSALLRDFRHAVRSLRRTPGFTIATLLILALGIGMSTAMFTVFKTVLVHRLPIREQDRVVVMHTLDRSGRNLDVPSAYLAEIARDSALLRDVAGVYHLVSPQPFMNGSAVVVLTVAHGSANYFDVLGMRPVTGRFLRPEDAQPGAPPVMVELRGLASRLRRRSVRRGPLARPSGHAGTVAHRRRGAGGIRVPERRGHVGGDSTESQYAAGRRRGASGAERDDRHGANRALCADAARESVRQRIGGSEPATGHQDPLGKRLVSVAGATGDTTFTVVGVASDTRFRELRHVGPVAYFVWEQVLTGGSALFAVRTTRPLAAMLPALRAAWHEVNPALVLWDVQTMDQLLEAPLAQPRLSALLLAGFSLVALLLSAIGLYRVVASGVRRQTRDIGVRVALGATPGNIRRLVLAQLFGLVGAGVIAGSRVLRSMLFQVSPVDPLTLAGVCVLLLAVATVAAYLPARRAARIDPLEALRAE
ncbi:MAG: ABC transporter permease [Longimicrobiales bacterium]